MLDLLWAAANEGTGRRAALATPTFGKTGTSQDNRDALFVGFAGDRVVGVWVGRDNNRPLGKNLSGGTTAAQLWRSFMAPAISVDGRSATTLPRDYQPPRPVLPEPQRSPIPSEWTDPEWIRDTADALERILDSF
jgi:penicillin-binding protein 1A